MGKQFALEGLHLSHKAKLASGRKEEPRERGVLESKVGKGFSDSKQGDDEEGPAVRISSFESVKGKDGEGGTLRKRQGGKVGFKGWGTHGHVYRLKGRMGGKITEE